MDIIYLLKVLRRRKWFIMISLLIGLIGGLVFRLFLPKEYVSNAQYATGLYRTQKVSLQLNEIFDVNQIDFRLNNVLETFKSPTVLGMMAYDLLEHDLESTHPFRTLTEKQKRDSVYQRADLQKAKEILRDKMSTLDLLSTYDPEQKKVWDLLNLYDYNEASILKKLVIERVPKTDYLNIVFSSENPQLSAYVVNAIGVKFREFYNSVTATNTKESLNKLDSLRESKRKEVDDLRKKLQDYREKIGTPNPGDAATAAMSGYQELSSSLTQQQAILNDTKQKLNSIIEQLASLNSVAPAPVTTNNNNNADEILVLRKTNETLATQLAQKGGNDPDIQTKIDANVNKIIQLRSANTALPGVLTSAQKQAERKEELIKQKLELESDIVSTNENIEMYKGRVEQFRKIAFSGGGQEVVARAYENDLETAMKDLDKYNSSLFASQDIDVSPDFNFKQTLIGQPAIRPEPSHGALIISIAGLSMFFIACLFIIILELLDSSLRTPTIFQKETKLNVLAVINKIDLQKRTLKDNFDFNSASDRVDTSNPFIENLRKLRYEIERSRKKIILLVSPKPQEGKSTILESLAYTFSMSKKKVLLIDANFSNNYLTREFSAKPALETFSLSNNENAMDKIWSVTTLTSITNTDIIGCNVGNYTPSEILPNNNLIENLDKVIQHYDFILMEGAALNNHADSKELAAYADGIIAVFSAKNATGETDKESIEFLKGTKDKFIGAVLNNVDDQNLDL
jgi:polysaccharide biosynthesis transport protein